MVKLSTEHKYYYVLNRHNHKFCFSVFYLNKTLEILVSSFVFCFLSKNCFIFPFWMVKWSLTNKFDSVYWYLETGCLTLASSFLKGREHQNQNYGNQWGKKKLKEIVQSIHVWVLRKIISIPYASKWAIKRDIWIWCSCENI